MITAPDLIAEAKKAIGDERDVELARRLAPYGLDPISTARSIKRWRDGETQPNYEATIGLLDLAGMLSMSGGRRKAAAVPGDRLASIAAAVAALERANAELLSEVRANRAEREDAQSRPRARSRRKPA